MITVEMFIPLQDNNAVAFLDSDFKNFEAEIMSRLGGFNRTRDVFGNWRDPAGGQEYPEDFFKYRIGVDSLLKSAALIVELAEIAKVIFKQLAIHVSYLTVSENL